MDLHLVCATMWSPHPYGITLHGQQPQCARWYRPIISPKVSVHTSMSCPSFPSHLLSFRSTESQQLWGTSDHTQIFTPNCLKDVSSQVRVVRRTSICEDKPSRSIAVPTTPITVNQKLSRHPEIRKDYWCHFCYSCLCLSEMKGT